MCGVWVVPSGLHALHGLSGTAAAVGSTARCEVPRAAAGSSKLVLARQLGTQPLTATAGEVAGEAAGEVAGEVAGEAASEAAGEAAAAGESNTDPFDMLPEALGDVLPEALGDVLSRREEPTPLPGVSGIGLRQPRFALQAWNLALGDSDNSDRTPSSEGDPSLASRPSRPSS